MSKFLSFGVVILALFLLPTHRCQGQDETERVFALLKQLESDEFAIRFEAENELVSMGVMAIRPILNARLNESSSLSRVTACKQIIDRWIDSDDRDIQLAICGAITSSELKPESRRRELVNQLMTDKGGLADKLAEILEGHKSIRLHGKHVSLSNWEYSETESRLMALLPGLEEMFLRSNVPSRFFEDQRESNVSHLTIHPADKSAEISGPVMKAILAMDNITNLELRETLVSEEAVELLSQSSKITSLGYRVVRTSDLEWISKMPSLTSFTFQADYRQPIRVTAEEFKPMIQLELQELAVVCCEFEPGAVEQLDSIPTLSKVRLVVPSAEMLEGFLKNRQITHYELQLHPGNADECAELLSDATHLKTVSMPFSSITDVGLESLSKMNFLTRLHLSTELVSRKGHEMIKRKLGRALDQFFRPESYLSESDSQRVHELTQKGLHFQSMGPMQYVFVFREHWTGSDEELVDAIKLGGWRSFQFDVSLTPPVLEAILECRGDNRVFAVYDSGQHPEGAMETLQEHFELKPLPDLSRTMMLESGEGDAFTFRVK